ncbi:MAG: protein kinase [Cyanobacteria bacterium P01_A01_bin.40]
MDNNLVGQTIQGRYYVVKQLGRGGVGVTFLAQDQQCFDSPCVVKQLKPKTSNQKALAIARRLFNREAEIMNRLGHCDRIPRLLAYFEQDNDFFLVQELIEGHDLSQEIIAGQPWTESKTIALVEETLEVLLIVQQYSVIHRDLKPSNLMRRSQDDKIILIDFGSVKQVSTQIIDAAGQVKQTVAVGTKSYMPMEQMMGHPGFYSDIYALGIIAIQALTGVQPKKLTIDDQGEIIWRRRLNSQVNYQPRFLDILDKMIRYRHQERYSAAGIVLADLKQLDVAQNNNKETIIISQGKSTATPQLTQTVSNPNRELVITKSASTAKNSKNRRRGINGSSKSIKPQNSHNAPKVAKSPLKSRFVLGTGILGGLILLTAVWGVWFFSKQQSPEPESELLLYENSNQGFRINYPDVWSQQNRDDFFATGVIFFSPLEDDSDLFKERVSILVEDLPENTSLSEYTEQSLAEIKKLSDPNVGAAKTINLGQGFGRRIVYSGEENGSTVRRMQIWSVQDNQAYIITYTARPESYETYLPIVEKMIESFVIVDN